MTEAPVVVAHTRSPTDTYGSGGGVDERTRIGANVRSARLRRGMSLEVAAGLAGRSKGWLSLVERGLRPLDRRQDISALADALEVSVTDITGQPYSPLDQPGSEADFAVSRVRRALQELPEPSTDEDVDQLVAESEALLTVRLALDLPALGAALPGLITRLRAAIPSATAEDRPGLLRSLFWSMQGAQVLARTLGYLDLAWIAAEHVRGVALELGDPAWQAAAEFSRAHALIPTGAAKAATGYATAGADLASRASGPEAAGAHGAMLLVSAYAMAHTGDLEQAHDALVEADRIAHGEVGHTIARGLSFGPPNVGLHRMQVAIEAGQPEMVVGSARQVVVDELPSPERRAVYWMDLGRAYAQMGQDDEATRALRQGESVAPYRVRLHPLVREAVSGMVERSQHTRTGRELRGLAYRMGLPH